MTGWVRCARGHRHWGRFGAASLLLIDRSDAGPRVLLTLRAPYVHHGGTWSPPGGAVERGESPTRAALREAREEVGLPSTGIDVEDALADTCGDWTHITVVAGCALASAPAVRPSAEAPAVRWVPVEEVERLTLHPGFRRTWTRFRRAPPRVSR